MLLILADFSREQFCLEGLFWQNQNAFLFEGCNWTGPTWSFDLEKWSGPSFWWFSSIHPTAKIIPKSSFRKTCRVRHYLEAIRPMKVPGCGGWFPEFRKSHPLASIRWQMGHLSQGGQWSFRSNVQAKFRGGGVEEWSLFFPKKRFSVCFEKEKVEWATVFFFFEKTQK